MPIAKAKDGTELFYQDWGSGAPVVLIHGWPLNADMWEQQSHYLASSGFRVVAYDRRGFGRSGKPWGGYDYNTFADDLATVMDATSLPSAALVGFSMGGGEVARYLSRHGTARVDRVAMIGAVTPTMLQAADNPNGVPAATFEEMMQGIAEDRPTFFAEFGRKNYAPGRVSDAVLAWTLGMAMQASLKATLDCVRAFGFTDFRPDLASFTIPTLIQHGEKDGIVPPDATAEAMAKAIPGAQLKTYRRAGHGLCWTHTDEVNADLAAFLRG